MFMRRRTIKTPPLLKDLLNDGEHSGAWLWGFDNIIPETAQDDIILNFAYYSIGCNDPDEFHNYFIRTIRRTQHRFVKLLTSESWQYDPTITNYVKEITLGTVDTNGETTKAGTSTGTNAGTNSSTSETTYNSGDNTSRNETRTDNLTESITAETDETQAKTNTGTQTTTGTGTIGHQISGRDELTKTTTETETGEGSESNTKNTTEEYTGKESETTTPTKTKTERITRPTETESVTHPTQTETLTPLTTETKTETGSEKTAHGAENNYQATTTDTKNGTRVENRATGSVDSDLPEIDNASIIGAMQAAAQGNVTQPAMTYATAGRFASDVSRETFDNYSDQRTETMVGNTYDETTFNGRQTQTSKTGTETKQTAYTGIDEKQTSYSGDEIRSETESGSETKEKTFTDRENTTTETNSGTTSTEKVTTGNETNIDVETKSDTETRNTTDTRTDNLAENVTGTTTDERTKTNTGTQGVTGTETKTKTGKDTTTDTGTSSATINQNTSENGTRKDREERTAAHIVEGRNGYSIQELLNAYRDFVLNSSALEWLENELQVCFWNVQEESEDFYDCY